MRRFSLTALASFAFVSLVPVPAASAADFVADNLHVAQTLTFGQASSAVTPALDFPVLEFHADSLAGISFATQTLVGTTATWEWLHHTGVADTATRRVLTLAHEGKLALYGTADGTTPAIVFDATDSADVHITVAGQRVLTEDALQQNFGTLLAGAFNAPSAGNNLALGQNTYAYGDHATAIGDSANAVYYGTTAVGYYANATFGSATAIGESAGASNYYATAIGVSANANGSYSIALGSSAQASSDYAAAIGASANASYYGATAVGYYSHASDYYTTAIGTYSNASYYGATAVGQYANATSNYATAIGYSADAYGYYSLALGADSTAYDDGTAVGVSSYASGSSTVAIGQSSYSTGYSSIAIGSSAHANYDYSAALGYNASANASYSIALGYYAQTGDSYNYSGYSNYSYSAAIGYYARATGNYATAIGPNAESSSYNTTAIGYYARAYYDYSTAIGSSATAYASYANAIGYYTYANASSSTAIGYQANTNWSATESLSLGYYTLTESPRQIAIGAYNDPRPELAFMIGNGPGGNWGYDSTGNYRELGRSNLFAITTEGKGIFRHTAYLEPGSMDYTSASQPVVQPDALLVEGGATIQGPTRINGILTLRAPDYVENSMNSSSTDISTAIILDASDPSDIHISIAGSRVLTEGSSGGGSGYGNFSSGQISIGSNATASYSDSIAIGSSSNASYPSATALGQYANATSFSSLAVGYAAQASGQSSFALGTNSQANGTSSAAIGEEANTDSCAYNSLAIGFRAQTGYYAIDSVAIGSSVQTNAYRQVALGAYNDPRSDALFMLGNGTGDYTYRYDSQAGDYGYFPNRSNAVVVTNEGKVQIYRTGTPETPVIELDPNSSDPRITVNGYRVVTEENSNGYFSRGQITIGYNTYAAYYGGTAIGYYANAQENYSTAVGHAAHTSGYEASAFGSYSSANAAFSLALGSNATANGNESLALGYHTQTNASRQVALGSQNILRSDALFMLGNGTGNTSQYNPQFGRYETIENRSNAVVVTNEGKVQIYRTGTPEIPIIELDPNSYDPRITINGYRVLTEQNGNGGGGYSNNGGSSGNSGSTSGSGYYSIAIGDYATAYNYATTAIGHSASATDNSTIAIGDYAYAAGSSSIAIGEQSNVGTSSSIAIGYQASTKWYASGSTSIGYNTFTQAARQVALGSYNDPSPELAFMIGNGTGNGWGYDSNGNYRELGRSNLFVITTEGKGIFRHTGFVEPTSGNPTPPNGGEALRVKGDATIEGTLRIRSSGDLSMGDFTTGSQP